MLPRKDGSGSEENRQKAQNRHVAQRSHEQVPDRRKIRDLIIKFFRIDWFQQKGDRECPW
ncbi:MAG: hypothetical protein HN416_14605 [Nitrospina sp.]|nr:hypothetical protein [Nitrospina sp.]